MTENERYWAAKKAQHQRALDFMAIAQPGETYRIERVGYYDKTHNRHKKEALEIFERIHDAKRVIEKCMYTGKEKIIKERS